MKKITMVKKIKIHITTEHFSIRELQRDIVALRKLYAATKDEQIHIIENSGTQKELEDVIVEQIRILLKITFTGTFPVEQLTSAMLYASGWAQGKLGVENEPQLRSLTDKAVRIYMVGRDTSPIALATCSSCGCLTNNYEMSLGGGAFCHLCIQHLKELRELK